MEYSFSLRCIALAMFPDCAYVLTQGLNLRVIHFHSLSDHGEAGHYHYDTQPDTVEYLAYFSLGARVIRVDRPLESSKLGHN